MQLRNGKQYFASAKIVQSSSEFKTAVEKNVKYRNENFDRLSLTTKIYCDNFNGFCRSKKIQTFSWENKLFLVGCVENCSVKNQPKELQAWVLFLL